MTAARRSSPSARPAAPAARQRPRTARGGRPTSTRRPPRPSGGGRGRRSRSPTRSPTPTAFAEVRAARTAANAPTRSSPASSTCSSRRSLRTRSRPTCAAASSSSQVDIESRFARHRGEIDGAAVDDNAIVGRSRARATTPRTARRRGRRRRASGAEVADRRPRARAAAQRRGPRASATATTSRSRSRTTDFDERRLFATLDEVDAITAVPFAALKAELDERARPALRRADRRHCGRGTTTIRSSRRRRATVGVDLDPYFARPPTSTRSRCARSTGIGLDVQPMLARSDLLAAGRQDPARVLHRHRPRRRRPRAHQQRTPSERWAETMLHEFGHAVYFDGVDRELPWLLRTMHFAHRRRRDAVRAARRTIPSGCATSRASRRADVDALAPPLRERRAAPQLLVFARWVLVMTHFERGLYADPDADHDTRWWDLVERFQLVRRPDGRHRARLGREDPRRGGARLLPQLPVRRADRVAARQRRSAASSTRRSRRALVERFFAPGASLRWDTSSSRPPARRSRPRSSRASSPS